tara:strand:+ start:812 stop:1015 length:204 start_codon:yes stop_codon:yes gene_type:complete
MKITKKESILILDYFDINANESTSKIKNKADELITNNLCVPIIGKNFDKSKSKSKSKSKTTIKAKNN